MLPRRDTVRLLVPCYMHCTCYLGYETGCNTRHPTRNRRHCTNPRPWALNSLIIHDYAKVESTTVLEVPLEAVKDSFVVLDGVAERFDLAGQWLYSLPEVRFCVPAHALSIQHHDDDLHGNQLNLLLVDFQARCQYTLDETVVVQKFLNLLA